MATVLILVFTTGGAELGAPADPTEPYAAARPEWYFMFLFQWLKYFPSGMEVLGAIIVPTVVVGLVAAMPILGQWKRGEHASRALAFGVVAAIGLLTWQAYAQDGADPDFRLAREQAEAAAHRATVLAESPDGIPAAGALALLRTDPLTQGPRIFAENCASCHTFQGHDGLGTPPTEDPSASDLHRFASREWLEGLLDPDRIATLEYFGGTEHRRGRMARYVQRGIALFDEESQLQLASVVKALSAEAELPYQSDQDDADAAEIVEGRRLIQTEAMRCTECHEFQGIVEERRGPSLTGYGSRAWMLRMVTDPTHPELYGDNNDRMPSFGPEGILTQEQMGLVIDWLREDWYRPDSP
ncbi:MAG: menaquinol-cytochrome C reductase, partial [Gemmatimonadetes bacterium]|nr:menaquinol-cytochrome C reductase [Gemmatimonadota bacterium]